MTWLAAAVLLAALAAAACGDNDTNKELDEARTTADESATTEDSATTEEGDTPDADETPGEDETAETDGTSEEGDGEINLNIRQPQDGAVVAERRPTIEIFVRNAKLRNGDEGVQAIVFVDAEPDLTQPPPADADTWARRDIRLPRLEDGEHTVWVALIDNTTGAWLTEVEPDSVTFTVDRNATPSGTEEADATEEPAAEETEAAP